MLIEKINVGGQAVIEGVMMRAPRAVAVAVRRPDGEIIVRSELKPPLHERFPIVKLPVLRGAIALFQSLAIGISALSFSANEAMTDEERAKEEGKSRSEVSSLAMAGTMAFAILFGIGLFFMLPLYATRLLTQFSLISDHNVVFNIVDGVIRIAVFLLYIIGISRMNDIKRVFQYHGAEHKSIFAYEAGQSLTIENVKRQSRLHPRCGTSFLLIVMLVSIAVFSLVPKLWPFYMKALSRVILLPLIAGLSYEFLKWSARNESNPLVRIFVTPGLALQRLTTGEPDDRQIEVAIRSLNEALDVNNGYSDDRLVV